MYSLKLCVSFVLMPLLKPDNALTKCNVRVFGYLCYKKTAVYLPPFYCHLCFEDFFRGNSPLIIIKQIESPNFFDLPYSFNCESVIFIFGSLSVFLYFLNHSWIVEGARSKSAAMLYEEPIPLSLFRSYFFKTLQIKYVTHSSYSFTS